MSKAIHGDPLLILDFGSQYTQLIARRVREMGVYCEIRPWDMSEEAFREFAPKGIILSGGPESVHAGDAYHKVPKAPGWVFSCDLPVLGICYGMHTMAAELGGEVVASEKREFGHALTQLEDHCRLFAGLRLDAEHRLSVWMSHGDKVTELPDGFNVVGATGSAPVAAMANEDKRWYALQFHPEVTHTDQGGQILYNFVREICGCADLWRSDNIIEDAIERVQAQVGNETVLLGLSGGVDSSVVAALLHKAIGDQLVCIFVDTGLLRLNEGDQVMATFAEHMGVRVERVDAADRFFEALKGEDDPEKKRKIIGEQFIRVFEEQAARFDSAKFLAQGTIYPDVIESAGAGGKAHVIKSHHNVGGLPEHMNMSLVEPLRELFKDEVRKIGVELGLPPAMVYRHPFPGPGLGVRILGEVRPEFVEPLKRADDIFITELRAAELYDKVSQAFAVFLPVKSVGVVGDARSYDYVVSLRAVETIDFMTARVAHLPPEFLDRVSTRIINEVRGISRVVYDISSKPPATIEWE
jgi:GMP synthase (glutamine-hydrolysing)